MSNQILIRALATLAANLAGLRGMRALVITNMHPSAEDPARGSFVRDQVAALRRIDDLEVEVFAFRSRGYGSYLRAARDLRRRYRRKTFDVVHAHFGLSIWPSLAVRGTVRGVTLHGTDLVHPRSRAITLAGLRRMDLVAPVSEELARLIPRRWVRGELVVLPTGVNMERFRPIDREAARRELGLDPAGPYLLFAADPARPEKRHDRALALAGEVPLLTLGGVDPAAVPLWINAANAVLVTSERESFGLAVLEALACDVPVLSTPVGIAPEVIGPVKGARCAPFELAPWRSQLAPILGQSDPRVAGRVAASRYSADRMAERVDLTWRALVRRASNR